MKLREAENERVLLLVRQMAQPLPAHDQHGDQGEGHAEGAVIGVELADGVQLAEPLEEARAIEETPDHLQTAVRAESFLREGNRKIALDTGAN